MSQSFDFEAWFDREFPMDENGCRQKYRETMVMDLMRAAWIASRVAVIEEVAQLIEQSYGKMPYREVYAGKCVRQCADAIRSLSKDQTK